MYNKLTSLRSVHGILQARRLEWVAIPFSRKSEIAQLCLTVCDLLDCSLPGSSVHGIFQAGVRSGLPFHSPGDLLDPGIEPRSPILRADALTLVPLERKKKAIQSCPTFCDLLDCSLPGSSIHGIFQARNWSGLLFPFPGDLPDPGIEPRSPAL